MADADSLHDMSSDLSAIDADAEDEIVTDEGKTDSTRKKSKKKKRKARDVGPSSGDSDSQTVNDKHSHISDRLPVAESGSADQLSGAEADTEGQVSQDNKSVKSFKTITGPVSEDAPDEQSNTMADGTLSPFQNLQKIQKAVELLTMQHGTPKTLEDATKKKYQFWETQPVPRFNERITVNDAIEPDKQPDEIRSEPYSLPTGFHWDTLDIGNPLILKELYTLLNENYVEDDDNMFRFDYSPEFLQWALQPPGWLKDWHCGVRVIKNKKLVGFISAVPANVKIYDRTKQLVEINFLCVHKKLRSKRVAPVLIREITRRVHLQGLFQAVYTAGVVLPKPVAGCRYWHRSLNPRKLIDVKFSHLSRNMTMQRTLKLYKLPESPRHPGFRPFTPADVPDTYRLLKQYLLKFELSPVFTEEEFRHWFIPRKGIIDSYVVESKLFTFPQGCMASETGLDLWVRKTDGEITDFVSFYTLPSTVMHHPTHKSLKAAYSYYNVSSRTPWVDLMQDALIVAKNMGFDVFNALDLMDNKEFLEKLKFGIGDGNLQYYLYNWKCPSMAPNQVGLVLQ